MLKRVFTTNQSINQLAYYLQYLFLSTHNKEHTGHYGIYIKQNIQKSLAKITIFIFKPIQHPQIPKYKQSETSDIQ